MTTEKIDVLVVSGYVPNMMRLKTTRSFWFPISEFTPESYNFKPIMIASEALIDPITNPEGVGLGWYQREDNEFVVGVGDRDNPGLDIIKIPLRHVTHFILVDGPY